MEPDATSGPLEQRERGLRNNQLNAKELWQELNALRRNPRLFYSLVSARKQLYNRQGLLFSMFHPDRSIRTQEGREPINNLLQALVNLPPQNPIAYNSELNSAADDIARQFQVCHSTRTPFEVSPQELRSLLSRSQKYIFPHGISCVIGVGFRDQFEPLLSLLVDDGVASRKNRQLLLSGEFEVCGVGAVPLEDPSLACGVYLLTKSVISKSLVPV